MAGKITRLLLIGGCVTVGWWMKSWTGGSGSSSQTASLHTGPTIEQVQALASLVTQRVTVVDAQETTLAGHLGSAKAALLVRGDFLIAVDLNQARLELVDHATRTATLILPQPHVDQPRVDHDRTRLVAISQTGLWTLTPGDGRTDVHIINQAYRDAQRFVGQACADPSLLAKARQQAQEVLGTFFGAMGWTVSIRWMD
jgi:hypothetical protein